ncbi:MAG: hypothetical protein V3U02_12305 [Calditrichia bacterium]
MTNNINVSSPKARITKNLLRHRMFLVRLQSMVKNRIPGRNYVTGASQVGYNAWLFDYES